MKAHLDGSPGADILSEARFYGELAPRLDVRAPRAYYAAVDDAAQQAIIIMDDVVANGGRFLSAHTPYSLDTTRDTLGQLARLHAATWGCDDVADFDWLTPRIVGMADIFPSTRCSRSSTTVAGPTSRRSCARRRTWRRRCGARVRTR